MENKERTVIHLQKGEDHFYFGSIKAIFDRFDKNELGISYGSLRNFKLSESKPYSNSRCIIRKGVLKSVEGKRGKYARDNAGESLQDF